MKNQRRFAPTKTGRFAPEQAAAFLRNQWPESAEYAPLMTGLMDCTEQLKQMGFFAIRFSKQLQRKNEFPYRRALKFETSTIRRSY
jgi:hypothetical protein